MATYFLDSGAAGTASGADWTNAFTTFTAAVAAATASGDVIKVHKTHQENLAVDTTYTFVANVSVICVDKDAADALATMGTGGWIGSSTANRSIFLAGAFACFLHGITFRLSGTGQDQIRLAVTDGAHQEFESCRFWISQTANVTSSVDVGGSDSQSFARLSNCTISFSHAANVFSVNGKLEMEGGEVITTSPDDLFMFTRSGTVDPGGSTVLCNGVDLSVCAGNLVGDAATTAGIATLVNCKLHASATWLAAQTITNRASAEVFLYDCHSGDTHVAIGHQNILGKTEIDTGIFFTSGAAGCSWKITGTANATFYAPYRTPWIDAYHTDTAATTPYFEILRDGSATAYQDNQVWAEWMVKTTSGSVLTTGSSDRMALLGTAADQAAGAGTGSWTGENATAWSGKCDSGAAVTPAEVGFIRGRLAVVGAIIVYLDPETGT